MSKTFSKQRVSIAALIIGLATGATAAPVLMDTITVDRFVDASGNVVEVPSESFIKIEEYYDHSTSGFFTHRGRYDMTVGSDMKVWGFGVSSELVNMGYEPRNRNGYPALLPSGVTGTFNSDQISHNNDDVLNLFNWGTRTLNNQIAGMTGFDIWGSLSNVVGSDGETGFFWYENHKYGYNTGFHTDFEFDAMAYSEAIVMAEYNGQIIYGSSVGNPNVGPVSAVPLPAAGWMLIAGVGGMLAAGRKRKA